MQRIKLAALKSLLESAGFVPGTPCPLSCAGGEALDFRDQLGRRVSAMADRDGLVSHFALTPDDFKADCEEEFDYFVYENPHRCFVLRGFVSEQSVRAALASVPSGDALGPAYDPTNFATPFEVESGRLAATPLRLPAQVVRGRDQGTVVAELNRALALNGLGLAVGGDSPDGSPLLLALNNNHFAAFFDDEAGAPPELLDLSRVARHEQRWAAAVEHASSLPNVPGDDGANAILFWTRS
jgi:hypothetical protein